MDGLVEVMGLTIGGTFLVSSVLQSFVSHKRPGFMLAVALLPALCLFLVTWPDGLELFVIVLGVGLIGSTAGTAVAVTLGRVLKRAWRRDL